LEKIAGALAVVGTSVLMGCGGGDKPPVSPDVKANEVAPTGDKASGASHCGAEHKDHKEGEATCGAKGGSASCGAGKGGSASCGAGKTGGDTSAAGATPADATATPASTGTAPATPATTAKPGDKPADKAPAKPGAAPAGKKAGASSCGAGTCSAKK
jgi:hypothetical protein